MRWREDAVKSLGLLALSLALSSSLAWPVMAQCSGDCGRKAEKSNMELVGYNDLQGRGAYQPVIEKQGDRWIAYIGAQAGKMPQLNTLTGKIEPNGTSIVDVTDPRHPKYIAHIPGEVIKNEVGAVLNEGGAEFVRVCSGSELPHADKSKFYLLRNLGQSAQETWDVTDPAKPNRLNVVLNNGQRPHDIHKNWWECDTGIAYLVGGPLDWPAPPNGSVRDAMNHLTVYDLSNPEKPVFIRSFGLPGQEAGSNSPAPVVGLHNVLSTGPKGNMVYLAYGRSEHGILEIVDRRKLLDGPKEPTDENLHYPVLARIDFPSDMGAHTAFPLLGVHVAEFAKQKEGSVRDFLAFMGEEHAMECAGTRHIVHIFDITDPSKPLGVSTWTVSEASGDFCSRGGRFGTHASNENFTPIYYNRILFLAHFNAGVRAVDVRDPYHPKEIGYYIPAVNDKTEKTCYGEGAEQKCKTVIQTNNVEVDDRGFIYIVDRNGAGMHILELTGPAREVADFK